MKNNTCTNREWWRGTSVYQIYPRSYCDSNGDGIGDLEGIISKLDYIKEIGFETIWISPFFASPQRDFGYDISDYFSAAPEYGKTEDIDRLISEIHRRGMFVIFDMVLNHTSDQHPWFIESRSSRKNPKRDWYIWKDSRFGAAHRSKPKPPNNWKSQVTGSGWQFDPNTGQWYWAAFLPFQPDLNYRNPEVKTEVFRMLRFWLDRGVDGFRLDIIGSIFEDSGFRDSPFIWKLFPDEDNKGMLFRSTCRTQNLPESIEFSRELRSLTEEYSTPPRFMVGETFGTPKDVSRFCKNGGLHTAFAFKCANIAFTAQAFRRLIAEYEDCFSHPLQPVWAFSNHDRTRRITALGGSVLKAKLNAAFQITARGIPFFYYGEEIGMTDINLDPRASLDPVSFPFQKLPVWLFNFINKKVNGSLNRDCCRTPMQWSAAANAGFCPPQASPWLPVNPDAERINVEELTTDDDSISSCISRFLKFRAVSEILRFGKLELLPAEGLHRDVLGFKRCLDKEELTVLLNFSKRPVKIELQDHPDTVPKHSSPEILVSTHSRKAESDAVSNNSIRLLAYEALVIKGSIRG